MESDPKPGYCHECDRPLATKADDARHDGIDCDGHTCWCVEKCWNGLAGRCEAEPVDWRARALAAERELCDDDTAAEKEIERLRAPFRGPVNVMLRREAPDVWRSWGPALERLGCAIEEILVRVHGERDAAIRERDEARERASRTRDAADTR